MRQWTSFVEEPCLIHLCIVESTCSGNRCWVLCWERGAGSSLGFVKQLKAWFPRECQFHVLDTFRAGQRTMDWFCRLSFAKTMVWHFDRCSTTARVCPNGRLCRQFEEGGRWAWEATCCGQLAVGCRDWGEPVDAGGCHTHRGRWAGKQEWLGSRGTMESGVLVAQSCPTLQLHGL